MFETSTPARQFVYQKIEEDPHHAVVGYKLLYRTEYRLHTVGFFYIHPQPLGTQSAVFSLKTADLHIASVDMPTFLTLIKKMVCVEEVSCHHVSVEPTQAFLNSVVLRHLEEHTP